MSEIDNELFELCKDVYERLGWEGDKQHISHGFYRKQHHWSSNDEIQPSQPMLLDYEGKYVDFPWELLAPLYTSDYLLEKLPKEVAEETPGTYWDRLENVWAADYGNDMHYRVQADTPLKALLKLTVALHEAGELK